VTLEVLFVDNHLLAVAKPAGVPTVPDESGDASLLDQAKEWVRSEFGKRGEAFVAVVHRLDRPVSGVVLFARTSKAAARLSEQFRERSTTKLYWGVAARAPREREGELVQWLAKDESRNLVEVVDERRPGAQRAVTRWRVVGEERGAAHLDLEPLTGRPHQLRLACASLGAPLLGDLKYGAERALDDRSIALHAAALTVEHPTLRDVRSFRAPAPRAAWWSFRPRDVDVDRTGGARE
jgi:23S rRNA pseudouridine1911/1915/1917 synthase